MTDLEQLEHDLRRKDKRGGSSLKEKLGKKDKGKKEKSSACSKAVAKKEVAKKADVAAAAAAATAAANARRDGVKSGGWVQARRGVAFGSGEVKATCAGGVGAGPAPAPASTGAARQPLILSRVQPVGLNGTVAVVSASSAASGMSSSVL